MFEDIHSLDVMKVPIYKGVGDKSEPNNYRPISVVPIVAKVLEKVVKSQLVSYLTVHSLIH